jgi:hypothetical protein
MDYALERRSGIVDLVEIEASTRRLFNQKGDPSGDLVHAEQQVLNWHVWLEKHHLYARETLHALTRPRGYVIIGRSASLTAATRRKLEHRNAVYRDVMQILTYDDLLASAEALLGILEGSDR